MLGWLELCAQGCFPAFELGEDAKQLVQTKLLHGAIGCTLFLKEGEEKNVDLIFWDPSGGGNHRPSPPFAFAIKTRAAEGDDSSLGPSCFTFGRKSEEGLTCLEDLLKQVFVPVLGASDPSSSAVSDLTRSDEENRLLIHP